MMNGCFIPKRTTSRDMVLGTTDDHKVIMEKLIGDKAGQLWIIEPTKCRKRAFTIKNFESNLILTATSSKIIEVKGIYF